MLVSSGPATFAHPYTGRRDCEQIGTFEKMWEVSESAGWSFDDIAGNLRGDPTILTETSERSPALWRPGQTGVWQRFATKWAIGPNV